MAHARFPIRLLLVVALCAPTLAGAEPPEADGSPSEPPAEAGQAPSEPPSAAPGGAPDAAPSPAPQAPAGQDVGARMDDLMDRMVRARTRLGALGEALYQTRVRITLDHRVKGFRVERVRVFLDGAPVHEGDGRGLTRKEDVELFAGFAAPGMHEVRLELEQVSLDDGRYGYTLEQRFRFRAVEDQRTELRIRMDDDSDVAEDFEDDRDGEYDVRTRVRVRSEPSGAR